MRLNDIHKFNIFRNKPSIESEIVVVDLGMKNSIDSSVDRNDGFLVYLIDKQSETVHALCRKVYERVLLLQMKDSTLWKKSVYLGQDYLVLEHE